MFFAFKTIFFIVFKRNNFLNLNAILLSFHAKYCVYMQTFVLETQCSLCLNAIAIGFKTIFSSNLASMSFRTYAVLENMYLYRGKKKDKKRTKLDTSSSIISLWLRDFSFTLSSSRLSWSLLLCWLFSSMKWFFNNCFLLSRPSMFCFE